MCCFVGASIDGDEWCLQPTSKFAEAYSAGIHKTKYWEPIYEDSLNLIAKLPAIAAHIYRCGVPAEMPPVAQRIGIGSAHSRSRVQQNSRAH